MQLLRSPRIRCYIVQILSFLVYSDSTARAVGIQTRRKGRHSNTLHIRMFGVPSLQSFSVQLRLQVTNLGRRVLLVQTYLKLAISKGRPRKERILALTTHIVISMRRETGSLST
jgi:hypothetical protein